MKNIKLLIIFILFNGCATVFTGISDDIYFVSDPEGADIYVDGFKAGETPVNNTPESDEEEEDF